MIVTCPVCATRQQAGTPACINCDAAWIDGSSREIIRLAPEQAETIPFIDADLEVTRLARAQTGRIDQFSDTRRRPTGKRG